MIEFGRVQKYKIRTIYRWISLIEYFTGDLNFENINIIGEDSRNLETSICNVHFIKNVKTIEENEKIAIRDIAKEVYGFSDY